MEAIRVTEEWQRAGVHYVRIEGMFHDFDITLEQEFDTDSPQTEYILVLDGHMPIGTCRLHFLPEEKLAKIERVVVIPEYRKKGVGRLAIEAAEEWILERGYTKIGITSRDVAVGFYEALGYVADYSRKFDAGIFKIVYVEKNLSSKKEIPFSEKELEWTEHLKGSDTLPKLNTPITPKENYYRAVRRDHPLWIPSMVTDQLKFNPSILPDNIARGFVNEEESWQGEIGGKDMFGIEWVYVPVAAGSMEKPGRPLMEDANDWKSFVKFPDLDSWDWETCAEKNKNYTVSDRLVTTTIFTGFFERLISFMDFEGAAMALIDEEQQDAVKELFDALADTYIDLLKHYRKYFNIDMVMLHDDWGTQRDSFFSEEICRKMIAPYLKKVVDYCHGEGMLFELHSCGKNERLVPVIVSCGVDIWGGQAIVDKAWVIDTYGQELLIGVHSPNAMVPGVREAKIPSDMRVSMQEFINEYASQMPEKPMYYINYGTTKEEYLYFYEEGRKLLCGSERS